eukprot:SAG11_NODE_7974_length_1075_cov_0.967213_1_plen_138_part_00
MLDVPCSFGAAPYTGSFSYTRRDHIKRKPQESELAPAGQAAEQIVTRQFKGTFEIMSDGRTVGFAVQHKCTYREPADALGAPTALKQALLVDREPPPTAEASSVLRESTGELVGEALQKLRYKWAQGEVELMAVAAG